MSSELQKKLENTYILLNYKRNLKIHIFLDEYIKDFDFRGFKNLYDFRRNHMYIFFHLKTC